MRVNSKEQLPGSWDMTDETKATVTARAGTVNDDCRAEICTGVARHASD